MTKSLTQKHFLDSEGTRKRGHFESVEHELRRAQERHEREMVGDEDESDQPIHAERQQAPSPDYRQGHGVTTTNRERRVDSHSQSGSVIYESPKE